MSPPPKVLHMTIVTPPKVLHRGGGDNCHPPPKYCTGGGVTIVTPPQSIAQGGG